MSIILDFFQRKKNVVSILLVFCALGSLMFCRKISKSSLVIMNSEVSAALKPGAEITTVLFKECSSTISGGTFTVSGGDEIQMSNKSGGASIRLKPNTSLKGKESISFRVQAKSKNCNKNFEANQDFSVKVNPARIVCRRENDEAVYVGLQANSLLVKCSLEDESGDILTIGNNIVYRLVQGDGGIDNNAVTFKNGEIRVEKPELLENKESLNIFIEISDDRYVWQQKIELPLKNFTIDIDQELVYSEIAKNQDIATITVNYPGRNLPEVKFSNLQYSINNSTWSQSTTTPYQLSSDPAANQNQITIKNNNNPKILTDSHIYFKIKMKINNNVELTKTFALPVLRMIFKSTIAKDSKNNNYYQYIPYKIDENDVVGNFTIFNGTDDIIKDVEITSDKSYCTIEFS